MVYTLVGSTATCSTGWSASRSTKARSAAANVLRVGEAIVCPASAPRLVADLIARGLEVHTLNASELAKAEGALTCCSLIVREVD